MSYKIKLGFTKLNKALMALEQMVEKPMQSDRSNIDATIQRFEFSIELFWKLLKGILESQGVTVQYPKEVLKQAFKGHLIDHENLWMEMLKDRNLTSHTYEEKLADKIYMHIKNYMPLLKSTYTDLYEKYQDE